MFGVGPMLPVLLPPSPSPQSPANPLVQSRKKPPRKRRDRYHWPATNLYGRSLGDLSTVTSVEMPLMGKRRGQGARGDHPERQTSTQLQWAPGDIERMAKEVYDGTITNFDLSLLGYWIRTSTGNYDVARIYLRELGLDQVSARSSFTLQT